MEKPPEAAWGDMHVERGGLSGATSVSHLDETQTYTPSCHPGLQTEWRRLQQRSNAFFQHFCLQESCLSSLFPEAKQFGSSLYVSGTIQASKAFKAL